MLFSLGYNQGKTFASRHKHFLAHTQQKKNEKKLKENKEERKSAQIIRKPIFFFSENIKSVFFLSI